MMEPSTSEIVSLFLKNWFQVLALVLLWVISSALGNIARTLYRIHTEMIIRNNRVSPGSYHSELHAINKSIKELKKE